MSEPFDLDTYEPAAEPNPIAVELFEQRLSQMAQKHQLAAARQQMWLAHHWPADYGERCVKMGRFHICRRCAALYPLSITVAFLSAFGYAPWPASWDPAPIWLLAVPATIAYCGEALGLFGYNAKVQVGTTLLAAAAFGRALGYEFVQWDSPKFWQPVFVFGLIWALATFGGKYRAMGRISD